VKVRVSAAAFCTFYNLFVAHFGRPLSKAFDESNLDITNACMAVAAASHVNVLLIALMLYS
jgi:hypothetical protein